MPQAQLSPTSDEYILDLLGTCEQKLLKLMDDLGGKDINDVMKEMEDAEVMLKFSGYVDIILLGRIGRFSQLMRSSLKSYFHQIKIFK